MLVPAADPDVSQRKTLRRRQDEFTQISKGRATRNKVMHLTALHAAGDRRVVGWRKMYP